MRSSTPDEPGDTRWDGSRPSAPHTRRALRLHPAAPTRLLRAAQLKQCTDCGNTLEWYYRDNGRPVPLHPRELPLEAVPEQHRWHVFNGVAHRGPDGTAWCRVPHRALCPAVEAPAHPGDPLAGLRRHLALNTRRLQDAGRFTPPAAPTTPPPCTALTPRCPAARRDVVQMFHSLYLAPGPAEATPCVALTIRRTRCSNSLASGAQDIGSWTLVPVPPGRRRGLQRELTDPLTGTPMAVYDLSVQPYASQMRWRAQRCISHADSQAADIAMTAWESFDQFVHHQHIAPSMPLEPPPAEDLPC